MRRGETFKMNVVSITIFAYIIDFCIAGPLKKSEDGQPHIVVIGAGISGLAAADRLINVYKFENVKILEALDRIGGRIYPVPFGDGYIQLGAEWLHHQNNPIFEMAMKLGLISNDSKVEHHEPEYFHFINQDSCDLPKRLTQPLIQDVVSKFFDLAVGNFSGYNASTFGNMMDILYQEFLTSEANHFSDKDMVLLNAVYKTIKSSAEMATGANDWHDVSLKPLMNLKPDHIDGLNEDMPLGKLGYKLILNEMIRRVPPDTHIQLNAHVKVIRYDNGNSNNSRVEMELSDGSMITADHVIVTSSLGYLNQHATVLFSPPLPKRKLDTIQALGFGTVDKLILIFNESFWKPNETVVLLVKADLGTNYRECDNTPPLPKTTLTQMFGEIFVSTVHPNALTLWIHSLDAPSFENDFSAKNIAAAATQALRKYFGDDSIQAPLIERSAWNKSPFYGSYSYDSRACDEINCERRDLSEPLWIFRNNEKVPLIQFAGEATDEDFFGTTHGAYFAGEREADRLADFYKKKIVTSSKAVRYNDAPNMAVIQAKCCKMLRTDKHKARHPLWNSSNTAHKSYQNDIALIQLNSPVSVTSKIQPIELPENEEKLSRGRNCTTAGWGSISGMGPWAEQTNSLYHINATIIDGDKCKREWDSYKHVFEDGEVFNGSYMKYNSTSMYCMEPAEKKETTCPGDSGGPLFCKQKDKWVTYGITSFGNPETCSEDATVPAVFTNIGPFMGWINETVASWER